MKLKFGQLFINDPDEISWLYWNNDGLWVGCRMTEAVKVQGDEAVRLWAFVTSDLAESDVPPADKPPKRGKWQK